MKNIFGSKRNLLFFAFFGVVLILLIELSYYFWQTGRLKALPTKIPPQAEEQSIPTKSLLTPQEQAKKVGYKIIYQGDPKETVGRTVVYEGRGKNDGSGGVVFTSGDHKKFIGQVIEWRKVSDSADLYLSLFDPVAQENLPSFRIAFEESPLFDGGVNATVLAVENLSLGSETPEELLIEKMGQVRSWQKEEIKKIIKPGDIVVATPYYQTAWGGDGLPRRDENGVMVALWLVLRRFEGKIQIERELGHSISF